MACVCSVVIFPSVCVTLQVLVIFWVTACLSDNWSTNQGMQFYPRDAMLACTGVWYSSHSTTPTPTSSPTSSRGSSRECRCRRRGMRAYVPVSACVFVTDRSVSVACIQKGFMDLSYTVFRDIRVSKNKGIFLWNFVPNVGFRKHQPSASAI